MSAIYIVRHGQTAGNRKKVLQGRSNLPLNEEGVRQAEEVRDYFRREGIRFARVYSSPLTRALETARIIAGEEARILTDERLLEMDYGPYEGVSLEAPPPEIILFFSDFVHNPAPAGMESLASVVRRSGEFIRDLCRTDDGDVLISAHAISMKGILEYLTPESKGSYWTKYVANCGVYRAERTENGYGVPEEADGGNHEVTPGQ